MADAAATRVRDTEDRIRSAIGVVDAFVHAQGGRILEHASSLPAHLRDLRPLRAVGTNGCAQGARVGGSPASVELRDVLNSTRIVRRDQPPLAREDLAAYAGEWVALRHGRVVAAASSLPALRSDPRVLRGDEVRAVPLRASASIY